MSNFSYLRDEFPALRQKVNGRQLIYLDTAATALKPNSVIERLNRFNREEAANIHRGAHYLSDRATENYESTRQNVSRFLNARSENEIVFTAGATDGLNHVAQLLGAGHVRKGDQILLTQMEHHSNIVPWQLLAHRVGAEILWAPVTDTGELDLSALEKLISPKTKVLAVTHCSNVLGSVNPIQKVAQLAHKVGAYLVVDAAQSVTFQKVDVQKLDCDFLVFSAHKLYGPFGTGVLYARTGLLDAIEPARGGGGMIAQVSESGSTFLNMPQRLESGTPNIAGVIGLGAAIDFVSEIGFEKIESEERRMLSSLREALLKLRDSRNEFSKLRLLGDSKSQVNLQSFVIDGYHSADIGQILDQQGVAIRVGHHCAQPLMKRFSVQSTMRVSFGVYNSDEDVGNFISALIKALELLK